MRIFFCIIFSLVFLGYNMTKQMMNIMIDKRVKLNKMKENKMIPPASSVINDDRYVKGFL